MPKVLVVFDTDRIDEDYAASDLAEEIVGCLEDKLEDSEVDSMQIVIADDVFNAKDLGN